MTHYLLTIQQPDAGTPEPAALEQVMRGLEALNAEIRAAGAWVFTGGLEPAGAATVVRAEGGEVLVTDGPYAEGKEHVGGLWIVATPDREAALGWAQRAAQITTLPIEVRAFAG